MNKQIPAPLTAVAEVLPPMADAKTLEELIGISHATLATWRHFGTGPHYLKLGGRVLYPREDVLAWLAGQRR